MRSLVWTTVAAPWHIRGTSLTKLVADIDGLSPRLRMLIVHLDLWIGETMAASDDSPVGTSSEFAVKTYQTLRDEVLLRIEEQNKLWVWKLATIGAMLSYAVAGQVSSPHYIAAVVPAIALCYDVLLATNISLVKSISRHIREIIEPEIQLTDRSWEGSSLRLSDRYLGRPFLADWVVINASSAFTVAAGLFLVHEHAGLRSVPTLVLGGLGVLLLVNAASTWRSMVE